MIGILLGYKMWQSTSNIIALGVGMLSISAAVANLFVLIRRETTLYTQISWFATLLIGGVFLASFLGPVAFTFGAFAPLGYVVMKLVAFTGTNFR